MWRYWYGLTQAWGSTTYDWALGQILPRCREEVLPAEPDRELCQREDTGLPWGKPYRGRIHIWDYPEGNQAIRTPSPVQGLTGDLGELTPVLDLASDCSAQSDCRGCLEDSTRVHHPGNWTGGEKRRSYPRVRGNGAASVTPASSSRPLLTQHTGRNWLNAEIVESCEGVRCRPARRSADVCQRGAVRQRMRGDMRGDRLQISRIVSDLESPLSGEWEMSWEHVGRTIELPRDVNSAQWLELRGTPEEEMAGELWHAVWSYTSQPVDVRDRRSVVRAD